uniref:Uncharacterized protein n=1 Tax=Salix viminalis TaxID=40686 RepID=A0A6N2JZK8_SALVM
MAMTRSKTAFVAFLLLAACSAAGGIPASAAALSCETAADCKKYPIVCPGCKSHAWRPMFDLYMAHQELPAFSELKTHRPIDRE